MAPMAPMVTITRTGTTVGQGSLMRRFRVARLLRRGLAVTEAVLHSEQERGERIIEHAVRDGLCDREGPHHPPAGIFTTAHL